MNRKKEKGMSILEAIVASVIVGIGFIGIFQMVGDAVNSIDVSGERTKATHLAGMIAEGVIGYRDTLVGVGEEDEKNLEYSRDGISLEGDDTNNCSTFVEYYAFLGKANSTLGKVCGSAQETENINDQINIESCSKTSTDARTPLYNKDKDTAWDSKSAAGNQIKKWTAILAEDQLMKCKSTNQTTKATNDTKSIKLFEMCRWGKGAKCQYANYNVFDDQMYVGRIQFNMNDGKKRRFLYFQADYKPKFQTIPNDDDGGDQLQGQGLN